MACRGGVGDKGDPPFQFGSCPNVCNLATPAGTQSSRWADGTHNKREVRDSLLSRRCG